MSFSKQYVNKTLFDVYLRIRTSSAGCKKILICVVFPCSKEICFIELTKGNGLSIYVDGIFHDVLFCMYTEVSSQSFNLKSLNYM